MEVFEILNLDSRDDVYFGKQDASFEVAIFFLFHSCFLLDSGR